MNFYPPFPFEFYFRNQDKNSPIAETQDFKIAMAVNYSLKKIN